MFEIKNQTIDPSQKVDQALPKGETTDDQSTGNLPRPSRENFPREDF